MEVLLCPCGVQHRPKRMGVGFWLYTAHLTLCGLLQEGPQHSCVCSEAEGWHATKTQSLHVNSEHSVPTLLCSGVVLRNGMAGRGDCQYLGGPCCCWLLRPRLRSTGRCEQMGGVPVSFHRAGPCARVSWDSKSLWAKIT